jgi:glutaredoxin-related protein
VAMALQVFIGGKTIGGGDDTKALSAAGKLAKLLKDAGGLK